MRRIRRKIWLVIMLLVAAMAVSTVIYSRGGFAFGDNEEGPTGICGTVSIADTLTGNNAKGYEVFKANCASCHNMEKEATGPALMGAASRAPYRGFIKALLLNPDKTLSASEYGRQLRKKYPVHQPSFKDFLSEQQINDVVFLIETFGEDPQYRHEQVLP